MSDDWDYDILDSNDKILYLQDVIKSLNLFDEPSLVNIVSNYVRIPIPRFCALAWLIGHLPDDLIRLIKQYSEMTIIVYAQSYNFLRISEGMNSYKFY